MEEPIEQILADDWIDQDLLTKDEAGSKLDAEIAAETRRLADLDSGVATETGIHTREQMATRLAAMIDVRDGLRRRG